MLAEYRRAGIARELMRRQHDWLRTRGYSVIETHAIQDNHAMARLNTRSGFVAVGFLTSDGTPRVIYRKTLSQARG